MTVDRRLHHAARELRAVPVDIPDLGGARAPRRTTPRVPAFAVPVLFVLGGLVAVTGVGAGGSSPVSTVDQDFAVQAAPDAGAGETSGVDAGASGATPLAGETFVPPNPPAITIERELAMIAAVAMRGRPAESTDLATQVAPASLPGPR